jgi:hypothetical protein
MLQQNCMAALSKAAYSRQIKCCHAQQQAATALKWARKYACMHARMLVLYIQSQLQFEMQ